MYGRSLGVLTTCALGARALLIPSSFEAAASPATNAPLEIEFANPTNRIVELPCSSCAFQNTEDNAKDVVGGEDLVFIQGGAKNVILNFTVTEDGKTLKMNDWEIYPWYSAPDKSSHGWHVNQVSASTSLDELEAGTANTVPLKITGSSSGYSKHMTPTGDSVVSLNVKINSLEHQKMDLSDVDLILMEFHSKEGVQLSIADASTRSAGPMDDPELMPPQFHGPPHSHRPSADMKDCAVLPIPLCRLKHAMEDKISGVHHGGSRRPGCSGRKGPPHRLPGHIKGPIFPVTDTADPSHPDGSQGPPSHMGGWKHHGHQHSFFHHFVKGFIAVMIPIIAGVAVGMTVSLLGMLAGKFIATIWTKITGARRHSYVSLTQEELEEGRKDGPAEIEAPPAYEHAPAYLVAEKE